ncbi:ATP-dependent exoDNAse (exonuclease V) beta subunit (contains helicase and exonuclease domains) [Bifidobacterium saguini DSM 23967]|uniref:DNA 3'-5' helicase n=2 Tax=Bifidobacterium saguini TaxID=762210 RepID=A0A087DCS7_9BIFI|nr:UvrD-helicase domain-containing protein [Bifidobacterium saguini]KFI93327.1 ATP-dependent exoDNAse (exonuclease V) beta subunit (contains helicase and exonuclease domains) [Bifidobacterium saguini DSM 23967]QTB90540.1 UvrD-helicase domain-containing protein [Bifidobacterium saguini]
MNKNTYVINASAGTGKTTQLLQDVLLDLLERNRNAASPQSIRTSLVITFTEAAAAEMRRRLESNLRFAIDFATANAHCNPQHLIKNDDEYAIGGNDGALAQAILTDCPLACRVFTQALNDLPAAHISTIDALAKYIVDRNFELLPQVTPGQQILSDEAMRHDLQRQVMDDLFEQWYGENDSHHDDFMDLLEGFGGAQNDNSLRALMFRLYDTALTKPDGLAWLRNLSEPYDVKFAADKPVYGVSDGLDRRIDTAIAEFNSAYPELLKRIEFIAETYAPQYPDTNFPEDSHYLRSLSQLSDLPELLRNGTWNELYALFRDEQEHPGNGLYHAITTNCTEHTSVLKDIFNNKVNTTREGVKELAGAVGKVQQPLKKILSIFAFPLEDTNLLYAQMKHRLDTLVDFIHLLNDAYRKKKEHMRLVDFSDVAEWALSILQEPEAAQRIHDQWRYIYVDESQDDNALQNAFVQYISSEADKLTMVGDVKQSIYGFRDASPEAFKEICDEVPPEHTSQLWVNYRSTPEIITFVNAVFDGLMTKDMGKVDYRAERLRMRADAQADASVRDTSFRSDAVELLLCLQGERTESGEEPGGDKPEPQPVPQGNMRSEQNQLQVDMIVRRVQSLIAQEGYSYGDIAILSRGATYFGDLADRLQAANIPVEVKGVGDFYKKSEITLALNWLRVIANAHQDIPLVAVLRSIGFTDDDLARLRMQTKGGLYGQIWVASDPANRLPVKSGEQTADTDHADNANDASPDDTVTDLAHQWRTPELTSKCRAFLKLLNDLRNFASSHPLDEVLWHLYAVTDVFDYVGLLPDGVQRKANLESLCAKARTFESTQGRNLRAFLDAVESWAKDTKAGEEASTVPTKNAVHVMTIHKAKGLQWPVVIVMNASGDLLNNVKKTSVPVVEKPGTHYGIAGMNVVSTRHEYKLGTFQRDDVMEELKRKSVEEELRLLYVALTRPQKKLIIAANGKKTEDHPNAVANAVSGVAVREVDTVCGVRKALSAESLTRTSNYLSWILGGLLAWQQSTDPGAGAHAPDDWDGIHSDGEFRVIPVPQNPDDADPQTARQGMRITVSVHADAPEPQTEMTSDTPGYAYTKKRMNIAAQRPEVDGDSLPRVPAAVNASGARYWMANAAQQDTDSDDDDADDSAENVIVDTKDDWRRMDFVLPDFMVAESTKHEASPAEVGTGAHNVLEIFDWKQAENIEACRAGLELAIDQLLYKHVIASAVAETLRGEMMMDNLLWFVSGGRSEHGNDADESPALQKLAAQIRSNPNNLHREEPFTMLIGAHELAILNGGNADVDSSADSAAASSLASMKHEEIVVRGVIDGFVVDDAAKSIILFDYKTDRVQRGEALDDWQQRLAGDYRAQQDLYARALEQRYPGYHVTERCLIGLAGHRLIDVS